MPIEILMPALSPTMEEGTLSTWLKKEGETVESGDVIAEIETDKATMEVEAVDEGIIGKILVESGVENVPVNTPIALLLEEGEDKSTLDDYSAAKPEVKETVSEQEDKTKTEKDSNVNTATAPQTQPTSAGGRVFASPLARRIANDKGIDLVIVQGSGPRGRIVKADVNNFTPSTAQSTASQESSSKAPSTGAKKLADLLGMSYREEKVSNIRKTIASRLTESKTTVPHFYLTIETNIDQLLSVRKQINDVANGEYKISVNDFIIKANAIALQKVPDANASWNDDSILYYDHSDISVAVATPTGLITPIIKKAETKGLAEISMEMKDLAGRARDGALKPEEYQGGTFSISNLGMFGVSEFSAIINPPQGCILAVGAGERKPIIKANGDIGTATIMKATLSVDHRVVDGAVGAEYLKVLKQYLENPAMMLV